MPKKSRKLKIDSENSEITEWLDQNSLIKLKLTLVDALGPIVLKHYIDHIKYLDIHYTSKVWNDVSDHSSSFNLHSTKAKNNPNRGF
jgi:hypothetical protein